MEAEDTKTCESCPTILHYRDFFLCEDCEEDYYEELQEEREEDSEEDQDDDQLM